MQNKFKETGRSMVEMLGVLAVIGVLSVSGILGYKFAMNKYIANETINELNIRASAISHHMEQYIENNYAGDIPMEMGPVMRMGYPITARMHPQYVDYFEMFISEVPSEICKLLLQSQWQAPYSIFIGTTQYESRVDICSQAEKVELAYEFHKDLLPEAEIEEKDRHEIMRCRHSNDCNCGTCNVQIGLCETNCLDNEKCVKDYSEPEWMMCCRPSNIVGSYCCASVTENGECCDWDGNCCPADKPLRDTDGKCYSCDDPKAITVSRTDICTSMCPKRFINDERYKKCILCGVKGTDVENKPLYNYAGTCYSCNYEKGFAMGIDIPRIWHLCSDLCDGKRKTVGEYCYPACSGDTPLMGTDGKCYSCNDETHTIKIESLTDTCEKLCPNRKTEGEYCKITCSTEKPLQDASGKCWSCDDVSTITVADTSSCSRICPNRFINDERYKKCILCGVKGTDVENKPLYNYAGTCYSCNYEKGFAMGIDIPNIWHLCSDLCDGKRKTVGEYCYPACSGDTPLMGTDGKCYGCNDETHAIKIESLTDTCEKLCPNRKTEGGYCKITCPSDKPLQDSVTGKCHACNDPVAVNVSDTSSCSRICPKRFINNETNKKCILCGVAETDVADKPLYDYNGTCYSCSYDKRFAMGIHLPNLWHLCSDLCDGNRYNISEYCYPKCPDDTPLSGTDGVCQDCNYSGKALSTPCSDVCSNRTIKDGYCVRTKCLTGTFADKNSICQACNNQSIIETSEDDCKNCLNRLYKDGYCYPPTES